MFDFLFNFIGWIPWWVWIVVGLCVVTFIHVYLGSNWSRTFAVLTAFATLGAASRIYNSGYRKHRKEVERENAQFKKQSDAIAQKVAKKSPSQLDRDNAKFVRKSRKR